MLPGKRSYKVWHSDTSKTSEADIPILFISFVKIILMVMRDIVIGNWNRLEFWRQNMHKNPKLPPGSGPWFGLDMPLGKDVWVYL